MEDEIPVILCQLEKIFPPGFFTIMVHLTVHLATEVRLAGPVHYWSMWFTESFVGRVTRMVHSRSQPEGAIAEGYIFEETLNFCSKYLDGCQTVFNRPSRHGDNSEHNKENYLRIFGHPKSASASSQLDFTAWTQAQRCVLFNYPTISNYTK